MRFGHRRLLALGVLAGCVLSLAALPALAHSATKTTTVNVTVSAASEFTFKLSTKTVKVGTVTFKFTNNGALPHDLKVCAANTGGTANACAGKVTPLNDPGSTKTLTVTFTKAGKYEYMCTVPGHASFGMKGILTVTA